ncbi:ATPase family AAA domain-containing 3B-like protein [Cladobotryum mycophilum]|uniref:ATPase family AAA domain-containing 3B-like protein n=1 Tax=Cladobotryum mycophilum TaxID=491253 RepID=A0ABR0SJA4_9HYPO
MSYPKGPPASRHLASRTRSPSPSTLMRARIVENARGYYQDESSEEETVESKPLMHYTISRDETAAGNLKNDKLRVLSPAGVEGNGGQERRPVELPERIPAPKKHDYMDDEYNDGLDDLDWKKALGNDYQIQLMLLEQQNRLRLQKERQERQRNPSPSILGMITPGIPSKQTVSQQMLGVVPSKQVWDRTWDAKNTDPRLLTPNVDSSLGLPDTRKDNRSSENDCGLESPPKLFNHMEHAVENGLQELTLDPSIFALQNHIRALQEENKRLRMSQKGSPSANFETFYCILSKAADDEGQEKEEETVYLEQPAWTVNGGYVQLKAHSPVLDPDSYVRYNRSLAFVVYKYYFSDDKDGKVREALRRGLKLPEAEPNREVIRPISEEMTEAIKAFTALHKNFGQMFPNFKIKENLRAPYLWWYYYRDCRHVLHDLPVRQAELMHILTGWIDQNYTNIYDQVDSQLSRGVVSVDSMGFLIRPGDVLVHTQEKSVQGAIATSWLRESKLEDILFDGPSNTQKQNTESSVAPQKPTWNWLVDSWSYNYTGYFHQTSNRLMMRLYGDTKDEEVAIADLNIIPLRFASEELRAKLRQRGNTFWSCRHRKLVAYDNSTKDTRYSPGQRFMVDYMTYKQIHTQTTVIINTMHSTDMNSEFMKRDEPPSEPEIYVFPNTIIGFDLRRKKWEDLQVDLIQEVQWNKQAFNHLVVDPETKELVQALVTNQLAAEKGTDLMHNKGNGLIMLLHGGPGTGKTFTAESVAEMAEKPLYPVTCGDIGTTPADVEKYLEAVFHLGKTWGCVVLLDEAEVFLEQRSLRDLARNALVSVFLRALEYYDGILILTSNRVGTFDEAFKSRIQLALHYETLTRPRRKQVWRNFFNRLRTLDEQNVDFDNIDNYIDELSEYEMNGRQIRNAITTARQWAQFQRRQMNSTHLTYVIKVIGKFDAYVKDVKEGFSDEEIAREDRVR